MRALLVAATVLVLLTSGCRETGGEIEGDAFQMTGRVTDVATGVEPEGIPEATDAAVVDPETGGDRRDEEGVFDAGSIDLAVDNVNGLAADVRDCNVSGRFVIFFREGTTISPLDIARDDDFPENLRDRTVDVAGTAYRDSENTTDSQGACQLVASSITVSTDPLDPRQTQTPKPIPTGSTGGTANSSASPEGDDAAGDDPSASATPTLAPNQQ